MLRPMRQDDGAALARFAPRVPPGERRFLKEDLEALAAWSLSEEQPATVRRLIAVDADGEITGLAGAFAGAGWSSHVAELRVVVSDQHRGQGIGRALAHAALLAALDLGCGQVYVEVVAEQEALVAMFQDLGFEPAALLPDFVRDSAGEFHDILLLTHHVDDQSGLPSLLGHDEVVA